MENEEVVNLHLSRGKIFVWNLRDVRLLRETHHIVGSLSGALPRAPRQNIQLGLPLELMPEEAFALISYGVGVLVRLPLPNVTEEDVITFQEARKRSFEKQKELYAEQIEAKKEAWKESENQFMSERKKRRLEKKQKRKKKERENAAEIESPHKSDGGSHNENNGRSVEECTTNAKDGEMLGLSLGMVLDENIKMESVTWSTSSESNMDQVPSCSTYTTCDSKKEISLTQVWVDKSICSSTIQRFQRSSQEGDTPQTQNQKTEDIVSQGKSSEGSLQSVGSCGEIKEGHEYGNRFVGVTPTKEDLNGKHRKGLDEHCEVEKDTGNGKILKLKEESQVIGTNESEIEMLPSERTRECSDKSERSKSTKEETLEKDPTSQGILCNKQSEGLSSEVNTHKFEGTASKERGITLPDENQTKKKNGAEELKRPGEVAVDSSVVHRSCLSSPMESIIVPTVERPGPKKGKVTQDSSCLVQLFTEAKDTNYIEVTDWPFPSTDQEKLRAAVFMHFWEQGYYLTSGLKFGGDFLVYKGNPLLFHSTYIAICIPYEKTMLTQTLVTYGRLGPIVKKTVVLCSLNENDEVRCLSLQWSGI